MYWMNYRNPLHELRDLQLEMNRLFNGVNTAGVPPFPAVNLWSNSEETVLSAELPGMKAENLHITVTGNHLTLEGERTVRPEGEVTEHRSERQEGRFSRHFKLPYEVESGKVSAVYKDGVLTVTLPRAEEAKPKRIEIKA
jgi:HSP20 family protein